MPDQNTYPHGDTGHATDPRTCRACWNDLPALTRPRVPAPAVPVSHLLAACTCTHAPGHPCDVSCPVHLGANLTDQLLAERAAAAEVPEQAPALPAEAWPVAGGRLLERPPAPALPATPYLWQSYAGEDAKVYADMYRAAAVLITQAGYNAADDYEGERGISIAAALSAVATERAGAELEAGLRGVFGDDHWARHLAAAAAMWQRELEIRLAAVLYATGQQLYDHSTHLADVYRDWEKRWNHDAPAPDQARAVGLLATAAAIYDLLDTMNGAARDQAHAAALEGSNHS